MALIKSLRGSSLRHTEPAGTGAWLSRQPGRRLVAVTDRTVNGGLWSLPQALQSKPAPYRPPGVDYLVMVCDRRCTDLIWTCPASSSASSALCTAVDKTEPSPLRKTPDTEIIANRVSHECNPYYY